MQRGKTQKAYQCSDCQVYSDIAATLSVAVPNAGNSVGIGPKRFLVASMKHLQICENDESSGTSSNRSTEQEQHIYRIT